MVKKKINKKQFSCITSAPRLQIDFPPEISIVQIVKIPTEIGMNYNTIDEEKTFAVFEFSGVKVTHLVIRTVKLRVRYYPRMLPNDFLRRLRTRIDTTERIKPTAATCLGTV